MLKDIILKMILKICLHTQLKGKIFKDMTSYNIHFAIELGKILYLQITAP